VKETEVKFHSNRQMVQNAPSDIGNYTIVCCTMVTFKFFTLFSDGLNCSPSLPHDMASEVIVS
jgi:hypothetical protein